MFYINITEHLSNVKAENEKMFNRNARGVS